MKDHFSKWEAFLKAVELGSLTRAAQALHYSQSGVSRMIQELEKQWGVTLLERGKSGIVLTAEGNQLLPLVRNYYWESRKLQNQLEKIQGLRSGLIRIGTFSSVATHRLPGVIAAFEKDYPNLDYELLLGDFSEIKAWIMEGRVDFGFLGSPTSGEELETQVLEEDPFLAILPEKHPLAKLSKVPLQLLAKEPFMMTEKGEPSVLKDVFQRDHLDLKVQFTTWDDYAVMAMVEKGLGVSILPGLILKRAPYAIATRELEVPLQRKILLAKRKDKPMSLAAEKFLEYLAVYYGKETE